MVFIAEDIIEYLEEKDNITNERKKKREAIIKIASKKYIYYSNQQKLIEEYMYKDAQ